MANNVSTVGEDRDVTLTCRGVPRCAGGYVDADSVAP